MRKKFPAPVQSMIEKIDRRIEKVHQYLEECDIEDVEYWDEKLDRLYQGRFWMQVIGHGLAAMNEKRRGR